MSLKSSVISLKEVVKSFHEGKEQVLKGVNLEFPEGKLTYILGSSGAGKSVLLKHILGLIFPDSGEVWVHGKNVAQLNRKELETLRLEFGMLFQNSALFDDMSVYDNVAFPLREHTSLKESEIAEQVQHTLSSLDMKTGWNKLPNELSGGMRKRVGLARAIIRKPSILLYDEPTTGLDPVNRIMVDQLIARLKTELKLTSIVISHDLSSALALADQIAFLHQGKIVFFGVPEEFQKSNHPTILEFMQSG